MDFNIPLSAGQSVLVIHVGSSDAEIKETFSYSDKCTSCVGSTGAVRIAVLSELGMSSGITFLLVTFNKHSLMLMTSLHILITDALCFCLSVLTLNYNDEIKPLQDFCILTIFVL